MSLTVGIDARKVRDFGIGRYLEGLIGALSRIGGEERYVLFLPERTDTSLPPDVEAAIAGGRFRAAPCGAPLYSLRELLAFRGAAKRHGLDLLHFPHYVRALAPGCPVAVTIHDPIHLRFPPSRRARAYARVMMGWSARSAALLFTVSESARADLAADLGVPADRFRVTPNGISSAFAPPGPEAVDRFRAERGLEKPFVLCVASHRPHKNLAGAVRAFHDAELDGAALVVPARDADTRAALAPRVAGVEGVRLLPEVADGDLPALYAAARVVLVPSAYEGFGLPALEAAACGAPVVASGIGAHREILGDAAAIAASARAEDLAVTLRELWNDEPRRRRLAEAGPRRAREFPWERTARLTLDGYRAAARPPRSGRGLL